MFSVYLVYDESSPNKLQKTLYNNELKMLQARKKLLRRCTNDSYFLILQCLLDILNPTGAQP